MKAYKKILALAAAAVLAAGCAPQANAAVTALNINTAQTAGSTAQTTGLSAAQTAGKAAETQQTAKKAPEKIDLTGASYIKLNGSDVQVDGNGAVYENGAVKITEGGTYVLEGTLSDGRVVVDAGDGQVTLMLNGAEITCSNGAPLYVYKSSQTVVHLGEGTVNTLTDGNTYAFADEYSSKTDDEPNACVYSKSDLYIQGSGQLKVNGNYNNGITGKDDLVISDAEITVNAKNNGITGKDSGTIESAGITVICGGDAIRSNNDTDAQKGAIEIKNSTLNLTAGEDGVQADTTLNMEGNVLNVKTGGGSGVQPSETVSAKGVKAGSTLTVAQGSYIFDCSDDAVHSNGDVNILSGSFEISTGDDAFHSDAALKVDGGDITVLKSYEGLEGATIDVNGGSISVVSSDDGFNAAGGADGSGFRGMAPGGFNAADGKYYLKITGGDISIIAAGDALDSNGNIDVSGGQVSAFSTGRGDGALDCDGTFALTGGTLLAGDVGGMFQAPNGATQYTICAGFGSTLPKGTFVNISGGSQNFTLQLQSDAATLVFSSPELQKGVTYEISYGGDYTGQSTNGICAGGTYSGGTVLTQVTLNDYVTSYGVNANGHMGGKGGGRMGMPPDGAMPGGALPDGAIPEGSNFPRGRLRQAN